MKKILFAILLVTCLNYLNSITYNSLLKKQETIICNGIDTEFQLTYYPIITNTLKISGISDTLLLNVDNKNGTITFHNPPDVTLSVEYSVYPKGITDSFYYFKQIVLSDSVDVKNVKLNRTSFNSNSNLMVSGSKTFSISVARDQGVDLDQSLFLRISGELSNNINIEAQLSDSESPISPEGNSKELSNLDEIYIRIYGKQYELAFGDLESKFSGTKFINYSTKFEGLKANYNSGIKVGGALAVTKAKNAENEFNCIDGKQGPYYLSINDNPYNLLIIPGTENVFINGIQASRGSDYTIDYSDGSITFIKIVNSNTSIRVNYQYSNERYNQNLYLAEAGTKLFDRLYFNTYLISKSDNRNQPIDTEFNILEKDALSFAGDNEVFIDGVIGPLEPGTGQYILSDNEQYYVYSDSLGVYNISFTYMGTGQGNYSEISPSVFEYRGQGEGEWLPIKQLYAPEQQTNVDLSLKYEYNWFKTKAEAIFSHFDQNTFSSMDDSDNDSWSTYGEISLKPDWDKFNPFLTFSVTVLEKERKLFADIKNANDSNSLIYLPSTDTTSVEEYNLSTGTEIYKKFALDINLKKKDSKSLFKQDYMKFNTKLMQLSKYTPSVNYSLLLTDEEYYDYLYSNSNTEQHDLLLNYNVSKLNLNGAFAQYIIEQTPEVIDIPFGTKYTSYISGLALNEIKYYQGNISYRIEQNDTLTVQDDWAIVKETKTISTEHSINSNNVHLNLFYNHSSIKNTSLHTKQNIDLMKLTSITGLINNAISFTGNYEVNNLEFYPQVRKLVYVGKEEGAYDENGEFEEELLYDYEYINSGDSELSIELNTDANLFLDFKSIFKDNIISKVQSESYIQVTENSRSKNRWEVYLLKPSTTFNDSTSIYSNRLLRQTLWIDVIPRKCFTIFAYESNKTLDNRYLSEYDDATRIKENVYDSSVRLLDIISLDWDFGYRNTLTEDSKYRSKVTQNAISLDIERKLSTKLILSNELSYQIEKGGKQTGDDSYEIVSYSTRPSISWYYKRIRVNSFLNVISNSRSGSTFLTNYSGKRDGTISNWAMKIYYKFNKYTSVNLDYTGNKYPDDPTEHKLTLEVKAEF